MFLSQRYALVLWSPVLMKSFVQIFAIIVLIASMALAAKPADPGNPHKKNKHGEGRQTRSLNGTYTATASGSYRGTGTATVDEDGVSFQIDVVAADGSTGKLIVSKLAIDGPYFSGAGSAIGHVIAISGRLDAAKASRLVATYAGANGEAGRITGILPDDAGDPDWDDKDKDKDKDKKDKD